MNRKEKLLMRFTSHPESLSFAEIETLLSRLGFIKREGKGSHCRFIHQGLPPIGFAIHQNDCKPSHKKSALKTLLYHKIIDP